MKNQFNELKPCWLQPRTLFKLLYNRFYEKMQCNATPSLNIIKPTAKQVWLSVLNIHRTTRPGYASTATIRHIDLNTPKKSHLKSSPPKKYFSNFPTQKNPRFKNFKPKNILWSPPTLEIPPGLLVNATSNGCDLDCKWSLKTTLDGRKGGGEVPV